MVAPLALHVLQQATQQAVDRRVRLGSIGLLRLASSPVQADLRAMP